MFGYMYVLYRNVLYFIIYNQGIVTHWNHDNWLTNSLELSPSWEASSQLVKKFPAFYGTWRFITVFTRAHFPEAMCNTS
jgi:hypothetical protein